MSIFGMAIYNLMMDRYGAAKAASGFFIVPGASALIAWAADRRALSRSR